MNTQLGGSDAGGHGHTVKEPWTQDRLPESMCSSLTGEGGPEVKNRGVGWGGVGEECCRELEGTAEARMDRADGGPGCGGQGRGHDRHGLWDTALPTKAPLEAVWTDSW